MKLDEAEEHERRAIELQAKCERLSHQIDMIPILTEQRIIEALQNGKEPLSALAYIKVGEAFAKFLLRQYED